MILDLKNVSSDDLPTIGHDIVRVCDPSGEEIEIDCRIEIDTRHMGDTFYIHLDVTGKFATACNRCAEPTEFHLHPSFDLVVGCSVFRNGAAIVDDPDLIRLPKGEHKLSLDEYICENLVVDIPMQIVCRDECRGLCSACGANLNREDCRCVEATDPRWDALRNLGSQRPNN